MMSWLSVISVTVPKFMVPRQRRLTLRRVRPSCVYSIAQAFHANAGRRAAALLRALGSGTLRRGRLIVEDRWIERFSAGPDDDVRPRGDKAGCVVATLKNAECSWGRTGVLRVVLDSGRLTRGARHEIQITVCRSLRRIEACYNWARRISARVVAPALLDRVRVADRVDPRAEVVEDGLAHARVGRRQRTGDLGRQVTHRRYRSRGIPDLSARGIAAAGRRPDPCDAGWVDETGGRVVDAGELLASRNL